MKKTKLLILSIISTFSLLLSGCASDVIDSSVGSDSDSSTTVSEIETIHEETNVYESQNEISQSLSVPESEELVSGQSSGETISESIFESSEEAETGSHSESMPQSFENIFDISDIEPYSGQPYTVVNNNVPYFAETDLTTDSYEFYSELDSLGRCGVAQASIGLDIMPTEEYGEIGSIKPSGWHTVKYNEYIDGNYLYNRCHLIAYQLSGENANEKNLITGTRYLNVKGMLPFENMVADYVQETENHVLYRVTPVFEGNNLVASGVLMEAESVEDYGEGILFCVYVYNVQPDIVIDYATGDSELDPNLQTSAQQPQPTEVSAEEPSVSEEETPQGTDYVLNTNTKKFHYPYCGSVKQMKEKNKREYNGTRDEVIGMGYDPCKKCNP